MKEKNIKTEKKNPVLFTLEQEFWLKNKLICGIDEVGRGCLAGPIVTAAVIINPYAMHEKLKDSKLMTTLQLEIIYNWIILNSKYSVGISHHRIIDKENIYKATQITMKKSLYHLLQSTDKLPDMIAIDAMPFHRRLLFKDLAIRDILDKFSVSPFVEPFHFGHLFKRPHYLWKPFIFRNLGKISV